jgi:hypothetical protein
MPNHPSAAELEQFALGTLPAEALDKIEGHIAICEKCCAVLRSVQDDMLTTRLRELGGGSGGQPRPSVAPVESGSASPRTRAGRLLGPIKALMARLFGKR